MRLLIVYGTTEGHTRKISNRVGEWVRSRGHDADVVDSAGLPDDLLVTNYHAFILAGSLHMAKHQDSLKAFVQANLPSLTAAPTAFLSVSLSAVVMDEHHDAECRKCMETFYQETSWRPTLDTPVAGALLYTDYDFFKRFVLRLIAKKEGGDTDTSRDYEYTDWEALERFVLGFVLEHVERRSAVGATV